MNIVRVDSLLKSAYSDFREGMFEKAEKQLDEALSIDFEKAEILSALKSARFWANSLNRYRSLTDSFEKGEHLLKEWKNYIRFAEAFPEGHEEAEGNIRHWLFTEALRHFYQAAEENSCEEPDLLFRMARCLKGNGDYTRALAYFEKANLRKKDDAAIVAELADCYALINEVKPAKLFFREAFFINPQDIEPVFLESMMIRKLIEHLQGLGYRKGTLLEWLPVYGVVLGVFNVRRELRPIEYGKLRQSIYNFENVINSDGEPESAEPRLLYRYFWLIDHYIAIGDARSKVDEVLQKLKLVNESIFEKYNN